MFGVIVMQHNEQHVFLVGAKSLGAYGIYGFCYYHYWFSGHMLLEKPMEQMLANKEINLPFCISWANEPWTKAWVGDAKKVLIPQNYGEEKEWKEHFDYLRLRIGRIIHWMKYIRSSTLMPFIIPCGIMVAYESWLYMSSLGLIQRVKRWF